jgi:hypothetical protein
LLQRELLSKDFTVFMDHGGPDTVDFKYIPFIVDRTGHDPKFIRYCDSIEYEGSYEPFDSKAQKKMETIASIEKSCGIKNVSLISNNSAGSLYGALNEKKDAIEIDVDMPLPNAVNKPPSVEESNENLYKLAEDAMKEVKGEPVSKRQRRTINIPLPG